MSPRSRRGYLAGCTLVLAIAAAAAAARADERPVIAVFDVESRGASLGRKIRDRLTDYLCSLMAERGYQVVPRARIEARLAGQRKTSYKRCYRQSCQIELGRELTASKSLATRILRLGADCKVTLTLYDLKRSATEGAATVSAGCSQQELVRSVEQAASRLAGGGGPRDETAALWPPACADGPDCLACGEARAKQGQYEAAFVALMGAELRAQKEGDWTTAIRANQLLSLMSMVTMPRQAELEHALARACKKGKNHEAFMAYARYLLLVSNETELALEVLEALCRRGKLAAACEDLGDLHAQGKGTARDYDKAIAARTRACDMGHLVACKDLGTMALSATGMERNPPRARELFRKACPAHRAGDRGTDGFDPDACHLLGTFEERGLGGARDEAAAAGLYKKACDSGYQPGCVSLGRVYEEGTGVARDRQRASKLFFASCKAGYADGCAWVGRMMEENEKVSDPRIQEIATRKAVKYYRKACEGGSLDGCYRLGRCHLTGKGVARDATRARELLSRSCSLGIEDACGLLAPTPDTASTGNTGPGEKLHGPRRAHSPAPAPKPSVVDHIDHGPVDLHKWGRVAFWSGVTMIGIGCTVSMVDVASDDDGMSGASEGVLWASMGTGSVLMLAGLVMMFKDAPLPSSTLSAGPTADGNGFAVSLGGTW